MTDFNNPLIEKQFQGVNRSLVLFVGILLIILGTIAIAASSFTTLLTILILGGIVLAGGIFQIIHAFASKTWGGFSAELIVGILYTVVGFLLLAKPIQGAASVTLLLIVLFLAGGLFRTYIALAKRPPQWGWLLFSGLISIALAVLIFEEWPASSLWVIGLFVGIDLLFAGWTLVMLGSLSKRQIG